MKPERFDPVARTEYLDTIASICELPQLSPLAPGVRQDLHVQKRVLANFP